MVSINSNPAAGAAARSLDSAQRNLMSSLAKLSSGKRIVNPYDDAGGEAVQLKLKASATRMGVAKNNIQNAVSYLQVQDGLLQTAVALVSRMGDLKAMSEDTSKNAQDKANYNQEFLVLKTQLANLNQEQFNGVNILGGGSAQTVFTTERGSAGASIVFSIATNGTTGAGGATNAGAAANVTSISTSAVTGDLQALANLRAQNGAFQSVMNYAYDNASIGKNNLEAARGRIVDLDIAEESSNFARASILASAASSMLAQANASAGNTLRALLG